jgi:hypothetical protein
MTDVNVPAAGPADRVVPRPLRRRLAWAFALVVLLGVPLLPAAWMLFIAVRASALQCLADQSLPCIDGTTELAPSLQQAIEAAINLALLLPFAIVPLLLLAFFLLGRVFPTIGLRLVLAALVTLFLAHVPFVAPINIFLAFDPDACLSNGLLVLQCEVLGADFRRHAEGLVTALPVAFWRTLPLAAATYVIYFIVQLVRHLREKRREREAMWAPIPAAVSQSDANPSGAAEELPSASPRR